MSIIYRAFLANERAIRRIFERHFRRTEDVDELTQETFIRCFSAESKNEIHNPRAFLFRAAKNLALSERKKKFRSTTEYLEDSGGTEVFIDEASASAEASLDGRRKLAMLTQAIASLPTEYRQAFLMRKVENLKIAQIAARMNVTERTAGHRVATALEMCLAHLRKAGYDPAEFGRRASAPSAQNSVGNSRQSAASSALDDRNGDSSERG